MHPLWALPIGVGLIEFFEDGFGHSSLKVYFFKFSIYVYLFITVILAQLQFSKWYLNLEPAILYLSLLLLIIRITIGSQSSKFHEGDL